MIEQMHGRIQSVTNELLQNVHGQRHIDLIADYALPIPTTIIAEMLGVPAEDRNKFSRWSNTMLQVFSKKFGMVRSVPDIWALVRYIRKFVRLRQRELRDDLVSELVKAEWTVSG